MIYNLSIYLKLIFKKYKNNIAIKYNEKNYTYDDLDKISDVFAAYLQNLNISQGSVVGIVSSKCFDDFAVMIACLKIGVIYTNLDIDAPINRNINILNVCNPSIIFTNINCDKIKTECEKLNIIYKNYIDVCVDNLNPNIVNIDGETVAYIMFTSGSTGIPKGVAISHLNILSFIEWSKNCYNITEKDNFANISPMYFDNSVFDFYSSIFNGASLTPIKKDLLNNPVELIKHIDNHKCTIWFSVPSMLIYLLTMRILSKDVLKTIRIFTFGGEGFPKSILKQIYDLYNNRAKFINVYGPTECTCICSNHIISDEDFNDMSELPSLGKINDNFSYVILDYNDKITNNGELCLLGPNIGIGYYNDIEKTNNVFVKYTNNTHYDKKMYKTGDIVEYKDGNLYFKGRKDNQIKHMGYRIELEDIENNLNCIDEVLQSAVIYKRSSDLFGEIIAYIVSNNDENDLKKIKNILSEQIPKYMLPNKYIFIDEFKKNQNGKIDKNYLKNYLNNKLII